jgi:hypothetical protein
VRHKAAPPAFRLALEFRGVFARVANRLKVTPSIVSRVARGERKSESVQVALCEEIQKILSSAGLSIKNETEFWGLH